MRHEKNFRGAASAAVAIVVAFSGCGGLRGLHCHDEPALAPPPPATVIVGGDVIAPGVVPIPPRGLTLRAALALAGGARDPLAAAGPVAGFSAASEAESGGAPNTVGASEPTDDGAAPSAVPPEIATVVTGVRALLAEADRDAGRLLEEPQGGEAVDAFDTSKGSLDFEIERLSEAINQNDPRAGFADSTAAQTIEKLGEFKSGLARAGDAHVNAPSAESLELWRGRARELENFLASIVASKPTPQSPVASRQPPSDRPVTSNSKLRVMVAVRRGEGTTALTHYFPYDFAATGLAGSVLLRDGDLVQVVPFESTSLPSPPWTDPSRNVIAVEGFVNRPGLHGRSVASTIPRMLQASGPSPNLVTDAAAVVLTRTTRSGIGQDVFVLPFEEVSAAGIETAPQDLYSVTPVVRVPIILHSLMELRLGDGQVDQIRVRRPARGHHHGLLVSDARSAEGRVACPLPAAGGPPNAIGRCRVMPEGTLEGLDPFGVGDAVHETLGTAVGGRAGQ